MDELAGVAILAALGLAAAIGAITCPRVRIPLVIAGSVLFLSAAGLVHAVISGSVLLVDPSGRVASVALVIGNGAHELYRGPFGVFYGEPRGDSSIRLICSDGRKMEFGYATSGMPIIQRLKSPFAC